MIINRQSPAAPSANRRLHFATLCLVAALAAGCEKPKDVTTDTKYGNFSTITGRWKTKVPLTLVSADDALQLWTKETSDATNGYHSVKTLATLPPGAEIQVEHLIFWPSFETGNCAKTGTLVAGAYAGRSIELDGRLFVMDRIGTSDFGPWHVNPAALEK